jgi:Holliday junction DNA helicase RuvA
MITKISGRLNRILDEEVRLQLDKLEYQVLVPDFVRRQLQSQIGEEITLHTSHYLDGNPMQGKVVPRLLGFMSEQEMDFFELFCTVDKVGIKKAIKALVRPVQEIADAIQRQDAKWLSTLPGIGPATADKVVATLRKKVTRFALGGKHSVGAPAGDGDGQVLEDAYNALLGLGHAPLEARNLLDKLLASGHSCNSVEAVLNDIYKMDR